MAMVGEEEPAPETTGDEIADEFSDAKTTPRGPAPDLLARIRPNPAPKPDAEPAAGGNDFDHVPTANREPSPELLEEARKKP